MPPCNLLLVDDSEDDIFFLKRAVRSHPEFRVVEWAPDGAVAISYLNGDAQYADRSRYPWPDIIVLDLNMPRLNGYELLEWMRGKSPRPKVAVFTTSELDEDKQRVRELGADLFQSKGFAPEALDRFFERLQRLAPRLCSNSSDSPSQPGL